MILLLGDTRSILTWVLEYVNLVPDVSSVSYSVETLNLTAYAAISRAMRHCATIDSGATCQRPPSQTLELEKSRQNQS